MTYAQDAMSYVREFGRPDLLVTFSFKSGWDEIREYLLAGQATHERHDITSRLFKAKLKLLKDRIVKAQISVLLTVTCTL